MRGAFLIIQNPYAGSWRGGARLRKVVALLRAAGAQVVWEQTGSYGESVEIARQAAENGVYDAVVAAGGDSTVRAVATGLRGSAQALGIVPLGTGNVMAQELGLPRSSHALAHYLLKGSVSQGHGALADDRPFLLMAGIGFDAELSLRLRRKIKRFLGKAAYGPPIAMTLWRNDVPAVTVEVDGQPHDAGWVVVTNVRRYAGGFDLAPEIGFFRPGLVAVLFGGRSRRKRVQQLLALARGRLDQAPDCRRIACQDARIYSDRPLPVQLDGEILAATPLHIRPDPEPLWMIHPTKAQ